MIKNQFSRLMQVKEREEGRLIPYREIAQATGLSPKTLVKWSYGRVQQYDAVGIEALCRYFECGIAELLVLE